MSPSVISLIGILLGMVILVFLAFKGYNVIIVSVIAALVVAVFAGTDILPLIIDSYMTKFADFAKNNFMIFLLSAVFGKLMGDSGAADTIAYSMLRVVNHVHSQRTKQLVGGLSRFFCLFSFFMLSPPWCRAGPRARACARPSRPRGRCTARRS